MKRHLYKIVGAASLTVLTAGAVTSLATNDLRPVLLGAAVAWLGAEYIDHLGLRVRR